jgi:hypothetical protein
MGVCWAAPPKAKFKEKHRFRKHGDIKGFNDLHFGLNQPQKSA